MGLLARGMVRKSRQELYRLMREELLVHKKHRKYVSGLADAVVVGRVSGKLDAKQDIDEGKELDLDLAERISAATSGTSIYAAICNNDLVMVTDGRTVSSMFGRVRLDNMTKIYWIFKQVFVLGAGCVETLTFILDIMNTQAPLLGNQKMAYIPVYISSLANKCAKEDLCAFIVAGRLESGDRPEIYMVEFKDAAENHDYSYYPKEGEEPLKYAAAGTGRDYMHKFTSWARPRFDRITRDQDKEGLKSYARDAIGEARKWDYCSDGNVNLVALFGGMDPIYQTAVPSNLSDARSGYEDWVDSTLKPHFLPEAMPQMDDN